MAVRINRVYTKVGDDGTTALGDGTRIPKTDPRIGAYAEAEETNTAIGVAVEMGHLPTEVTSVLRVIQNHLFDVGADLATPIAESPAYPPLRVTDEYIERLEGWCDEYNEQLPKLQSFILPGGSHGAALLHNSRTVARRAERAGWALIEHDPEHTNSLAVKYLNRLSDLLFILARHSTSSGDVLWEPGGAGSATTSTRSW